MDSRKELEIRAMFYGVMEKLIKEEQANSKAFIELNPGFTRERETICNYYCNAYSRMYSAIMEEFKKIN